MKMSHFDASKINADFVKNYQRQMPENRILAHQFVKNAIDGKLATIKQLAAIFGTNRGKIYRIYCGLDVNCLPSQWSKDEDNFIIASKGVKTYKEISKVLGRPISGVQYRACFLGISRPNCTR